MLRVCGCCMCIERARARKCEKVEKEIAKNINYLCSLFFFLFLYSPTLIFECPVKPCTRTVRGSHRNLYEPFTISSSTSRRSKRALFDHDHEHRGEPIRALDSVLTPLQEPPGVRMVLCISFGWDERERWVYVRLRQKDKERKKGCTCNNTVTASTYAASFAASCPSPLPLLHEDSQHFRHDIIDRSRSAGRSSSRLPRRGRRRGGQRRRGTRVATPVPSPPQSFEVWMRSPH